MNQPAKQSLRSAETIAPRRAMDSAAVPAALFVTLPTQFGRFRVERLLGRGAMGEVYWAWDMQLDRPVALKVPRFSGDEGDELARRLLREAKAAANLNHANICRVYDSGVEAGTYFIAMEFIEGRPLSDYITPGQFLSEQRTVDLVRKLASALAEAHAKGVIHRDLKPGNILVNERGEPILTDFGLARRADAAHDVRVTQTGMLIGSPAYMSPEQADGETGRVGPWSDIYSLGVVLFELLTGQLPFQGSVVVILSQVMLKEPPLPSSLRPGLDPRLDVICRKMMAKRPQDRFASMMEVEQELAAWLDAVPQPARRASEWSSESNHSLALRAGNAAEQPEQKAAASESLSLAPASGERAEARGPTPTANKSIAPPNDVAQQQQQRAKQFLAKRDYEAAIPLLTKLAALKEPQFQETATWAKQTLPTAQEQHQKLREAAVAACQKARALLKQHDYSGAVQVLELIPVAGRTTELQQLLAESTDLADECSSLRQDIDESLKRKKYSRLRSLLERYLKLKPDSPKMERLLRNLEKNHPARAVANFQETQTYYDVAGRLFEPKEVAMSAFVILGLFFAVSYSVHNYLANSDDAEPLVTVAGDATAERPKPPPVASQPSPASNTATVLPVPKPARITIQQLPAVSLKAGETQRFMVRVERENTENTNGAVRLEFQGLPGR